MTTCDKCGIKVDTIGSTCPLCKSKIDENRDPTFPIIKNRHVIAIAQKIVFTVFLTISLIVILLNYSLTPDTKWSVFVIAGLVSMFLIFNEIIRNKQRILSKMFTFFFIITLITISWDYLLGFKGWSLNYVLPSTCISYGIFLLILRFVSYFAFKENMTAIYLNVLLEFVPLILYYRGIITFKPLALICAIMGIINCIILFVFDFYDVKEYIEKKLHL